MRVRDKILVVVILALILAIGLIVYLREGGGPGDRGRSAFPNIKVAVQYRYVTDGGLMNRSVDDVIEIFKDLGVDFIFQGWMTQKPRPDRCSDLPPREAEKCKLLGRSYEH